MRTHGIDVSTWQKVINWKAVKEDGTQFAMIKATQGKLVSDPSVGPFVDSYFYRNIKGASSAGLKVGVWHYLCADNIPDAEMEATYFVKTIAPYRKQIDLWAAIDVEQTDMLPKSGVLLTQVVERFAEIIRSAGFKPMLYTNPDYILYHYAKVPDLPLWLAYWGASEQKALEYKPLIWQPKELPAGSIKGISTKVDMDVGYFDLADQTIKVGDKVRVISNYIYNSIRRFAVYYNAYDVLAVNGDRVVIGIGSVVTAAVNAKNLRKCDT